ncbi:MAG: decarboxylating 6-phosphogluconate dehydrogenase [Trueperaceae bacterium]
MDVGVVGLGKMGANMARRLIDGGHRVVASDLDREAVERAAAHGAEPAGDLAELVAALASPKVVWLMLPAGDVTESVLNETLPLLGPGDILVDGANSFWKDSRRRGETAAELGVEYVDCGVSGGVWGLENGYNLMLGSGERAFETLRPALEALAAPDGYLRVGPVGTGHFVKMIHNGIEYGLMQAYGEGFEALAAYPDADIDLAAVAGLWMHGSVIRSWLLELGLMALEEDPRLERVLGYVEDSGMGRWTVDFAVEEALPLPAITAALYARFGSRQENAMSARLTAALRREFGGHGVTQARDESDEDA